MSGIGLTRIRLFTINIHLFASLTILASLVLIHAKTQRAKAQRREGTHLPECLPVRRQEFIQAGIIMMIMIY
jgi:hypothetical protein